MITHFADICLPTVSIAGVKQVYADRLGLPITNHTEHQITFGCTPAMTLTFSERHAPIAPAHFAFQVAFDRFAAAAQAIKQAGLIIARREDGGEEAEAIDNMQRRARNLYFRDGDGHLLEIIAHDDIDPQSLPTTTELGLLYLREMGMPVADAPACCAWLRDLLDMQILPDDDPAFNFVMAGTAYAVVVAATRRWIPIAMQALPPNARITFGTPDRAFWERVRERLITRNALQSATATELSFSYIDYCFRLRLTDAVPADLPTRIGETAAQRKASGLD